jgi:hypothetical protein
MATSPWRAATTLKGVKDQPLSPRSGVTDNRSIRSDWRRGHTEPRSVAHYCHQPVPCKSANVGSAIRVIEVLPACRWYWAGL